MICRQGPASHNPRHKGFGPRHFTSQEETIKTRFFQQDYIILWHVRSNVSFHNIFNVFKPHRKKFLYPVARYKKGYKITSIHSPNQEVLEYPQKYASILRLQKLYLVHLANSTRHDCLVLVQFDLVYTFFYSRQGLWLVFFDLQVVRQVNIDICIRHLQVVRFLLDMFGLLERCLV